MVDSLGEPAAHKGRSLWPKPRWIAYVLIPLIALALSHFAGKWYGSAKCEAGILWGDGFPVRQQDIEALLDNLLKSDRRVPKGEVYSVVIDLSFMYTPTGPDVKFAPISGASERDLDVLIRRASDAREMVRGGVASKLRPGANIESIRYAFEVGFQQRGQPGFKASFFSYYFLYDEEEYFIGFCAAPLLSKHYA